MIDKKFVTKESVALVFTVISFFTAFVAYAEKRLEVIESKARQELRDGVVTVSKQIDDEKQERQEGLRQVNTKLDTIINILAGRRGNS